MKKRKQERCFEEGWVPQQRSSELQARKYRIFPQSQVLSSTSSMGFSSARFPSILVTEKMRKNKEEQEQEQERRNKGKDEKSTKDEFKDVPC